MSLSHPFTLTLRNGRTKSFKDGAAMYKWFIKNKPSLKMKKGKSDGKN